jgi:hypothetical protein
MHAAACVCVASCVDQLAISNATLCVLDMFPFATTPQADHAGPHMLLLLLLLQVADRGGLPAVAAAAAAGAAGPVPEGAAESSNTMGENLGEFWWRTGGGC